jgi:flagella basal body P-ring formation protein FlgA
MMLLFTTALFLFSAGGSEGSESPSLILKDQARVEGSRVLLGEVAFFKNGSPEVIQQWKKIDLGLSPKPGYTRYLSKEMIESVLKKQEGRWDEGLELKGADGVMVSVKSIRISGPELVRLGMDYLKGQVAGLQGERIIEPVRQPGDLLVPAGQGLTAFDVAWHNTPKGVGTVSLDLKVRVDGEIFTTLPMQFNIRLFDRVLVAAGDIGRGEPFTPSNTRTARAEITFMKDTPARNLMDLNLRRAKTQIPAGSVIRIEDGYYPALVFQGRPVNVTVRKGTLLIRARGIARQNATLGDTVVVLNPESGRSFRCVVTGPNKVEVKL